MNLQRIGKKLVSICLSVTIILLYYPFFTGKHDTVYAMTNSEITAAITALQSKYPSGKYWNHEYGHSYDGSGVTSSPCPNGNPDNGRCNRLYGGSQCYAFARQIAKDVFGSYPALNVASSSVKTGTVSNGWTAIKEASKVTLEPGDIIRADYNSHTAIVWKIEGQNVYVAQCWGTSGCKINWGAFWGNNKKATISELLGAGFNGVWKHPGGGHIDPYISISGYDPLPSGKLTQGKSYPVKGIVSGYPNINHVWGGVYNRDGSKTAQFLDKYVDTGSYNLATYFDPYIIFNNLPVGYYTFKIEATTTDGQYKEIHSDFQIGDPPPSTYTVSLNANGGSVSPTSITVSANGTYSGLPTPSRTGYDFLGWFTSASGGTQKSNGSGLASNSDHTLYAHWNAKKFTVAFNANGGAVLPASKTVTYDSTYGDLPTPSKTGYSFQGWFTAASGGTQISSGTKVNITSNQTLYAHWNNGNSYTVSFDGNGGTASSASKKVTYGGTYGDLPSGSKKGYTLKGWFTAKSSGTQVTSGTKVSTASDHTLYAQWTANQYNITLIYNDGTDKSETVKVTYDSSYGLKEPEREGYFFNGWFTAATGGTQIATSAKVAVASDQKLYAHWSKDQLMLSFNPMGGKTDVASKLLTYDNRYGILPEAERTGYTFEGWYLDEAYTQPITETDVVKATGNQTAYAKWSIRQYIVTFDAGEGTPDVENKKVAFGKAYGALPDATWSDREFLGWYTDDDTEITSDSIVELENDTVLYAKWRLMGDVNVDGVFDIQDVIMVQEWLLAKPDATLTDWRAADACQDERIDVFDLCLLKRWLIERNGDMQ